MSYTVPLYFLCKITFVLLLVILLVLYTIIHNPPKPQGFVYLSLQSLAVSFNLRVKNHELNINLISKDKDDVKNLLEKNESEAYNNEDKKILSHLKKEYPDAFIRQDNPTLEKVLIELEEYLEDIHNEEETKARERWKNTHPPIPVTDWNNSRPAKSDLGDTSSQSTQGASTNDYYQSSSLPVNTSSSTSSDSPLRANVTDSLSSKSLETKVKKESAVDYVVDQMDTEMPNYGDMDD